MKWRNRRGRLESSLQILYDNSNRSEEELVRADLWWKQRESIVRSLIYKKRYKTAYKISSEHALSAGPSFAEAEWLSGWIAITFLNSPEYAISHFQNFYNNVSYPISLARGAYWLGQSYENLGEKDFSNKFYSEAAKFPMTYYGQLAFNKINPGGNFELVDQSTFSKEYEKEFKKNKLIRHIILLKELDATQLGKDIFKHLAELNIESGSEVLAADLATSVERYDFAIQISKKASYQKRFYNKFNYSIIATPLSSAGRIFIIMVFSVDSSGVQNGVGGGSGTSGTVDSQAMSDQALHPTELQERTATGYCVDGCRHTPVAQFTVCVVRFPST